MNITINLKSIDDAQNIYNKNLLNEALDQYILNNCHYKLLKNTINLNITGIKNAEEQKYLSNLIHNYYLNKLSISKKIDILDNYFRIILLIIGIIAILISKEFSSFLSELFLIAGWVVIWEVIYDLLFNEIKRKRNNKVLKSLANSPIKFH